jgi:hypothetical protein
VPRGYAVRRGRKSELLFVPIPQLTRDETLRLLERLERDPDGVAAECARIRRLERRAKADAVSRATVATFLEWTPGGHLALGMTIEQQIATLDDHLKTLSLESGGLGLASSKASTRLARRKGNPKL